MLQTYLQMNCWSTMTVVFLYRMIAFNSPKFNGNGFCGIKYKHWVHILCWLMPVVMTIVMSLVPKEGNLFHEDLWSTSSYLSELDGVGWCGVQSHHRILKAVFLNMPQLILVPLQRVSA